MKETGDFPEIVMKKAVICIILTLSVISSMSALEVNLGFHIIPGFSWQIAEYSGLSDGAFQLTNLTVDAGLNFRLGIAGSYFMEARAGVISYFLLEKDLESIHSDLAAGNLYYRSGDSCNIYALLDIAIPFPSPKVRFTGGVRYNYTQNLFMLYLTGGFFLRAGFELEIIEKQMLKIILEIKPFNSDPFHSVTGDTLSSVFTLNIQACYAGVFFK